MTIADQYISTGQDFRIYLGAVGQDVTAITTFASIAAQIAAGNIEDITDKISRQSVTPTTEIQGTQPGKAQWTYRQGVISALDGDFEIYAAPPNKRFFRNLHFQAHGLVGVAKENRAIWIFEDTPAVGVDCWRGYFLPSTVPSGSGTGALSTINISFALNIDDNHPYHILT